jgi:hypothetical protein
MKHFVAGYDSVDAKLRATSGLGAGGGGGSSSGDARRLTGSRSLPAVITTSLSLSDLEDKTESFAYFMVLDFLQRKGLKRTVAALHAEAPSLGGIAPSDEAWYGMATEIDLPALLRHAAARGGRHATVVEMMVRACARRGVPSPVLPRYGCDYSPPPPPPPHTQPPRGRAG